MGAAPLMPNRALSASDKVPSQNPDGTVPKNEPIKMNADPVCLRENKAPQFQETYEVGSDGKSLANVFVYVKDGLGNYIYDTPTKMSGFNAAAFAHHTHLAWSAPDAGAQLAAQSPPWRMPANQQLLGVDVAFRKHHKRHTDFRRGRRLGRNDHVVTWEKPSRPKWMDQATYDSLPVTLALREVRGKVETPGCRVKELVIVTTLLDDDTYSIEDILELYHERWHAELGGAA